MGSESKRGARATLPAAILAFGAIDAWCRRDIIYSDGISYLEIADAYARGEWGQAINAYWSPFYSWILAAVFSVFRPPLTSELAWLHAVNWLLLCAAALAFGYLLRELRLRSASGAYGDHLAPVASGPYHKTFHAIAWLTFAWGCLSGRLIGLFRPLPDMAAAGIVFAAAGLLLRMRAAPRRNATAALLGIVLGIGYLTKAAMLPLALVFIACSGRLRRAAIAAASFAAVCAPFVIALSVSKGRFTTGESGRLNYAWEVGPVRRSTHWQGGPPGYGEPVHPTRVLHREPLLAEFEKPVPGSFPPWRDPSYWYEGVKPHFNAARQAQSLYLNGRYTLVLFLLCPATIAAALAMLLSRGLWGALPSRLAVYGAGLWRLWPLLAPCAAAFAMYSSVFVEGRYIAPFLVVAGVSILIPAFGTPALSGRRRRAAIVAAAAIATIGVLRGDLAEDVSVIRAWVEGHPEATQADLASEMRLLGIGPGTRLGYIGLAMNAYWVRLAGARTICEVPIEYVRQHGLSRGGRDGTAEIERYWKSPPRVRDRVLQLMRAQGAEYAVADMVPGWADTSGWTQLRTPAPKGYGDARTFVRRLN
ncbi:MAG TPA: hypothetical protein VN428_10825 [Bryobacteraceae bacterium]|nr:hypothetical protein [Bryobacteraceae bacterium]